MKLKAGRFYVTGMLLAFIVCASSALASPGDIHTFAGLGVQGYGGDGGPAAAARTGVQHGVCADAAGNVYFSDSSNHRIRKVDPSGTVTTVAGTGTAGYSGDGGQARYAAINGPAQVAVDAAGNVYFADSSNNRVRRIDASGVITTVAGNGMAGFSGDGGPAAAAALNRPGGVALDSYGNLHIADSANNCVRKVTRATGAISLYAGTGAAGFSGDGGQARYAKLNIPEGLAFDTGNNLYIADSNNHRVRKVASSGVIRTAAGTGAAGYSGDGGHARYARLNYPSGVAAGPNGFVYIADRNNHLLRAVNKRGKISSAAGTGAPGFSGDGGQAKYARLNYPFSVAADRAGNVFIGDNNNFRVRMMEGASYALPTSQIASPVSGAPVSGSVTVTGTASGPRGIAYVQVSVDGGQTWATASGTASWGFKWTPPSSGGYVLMSRATGVDGKAETICSAVYVTAGVTQPSPVVINSLVPGAASPAAAGTTVTWTASASGGSGSYQYQFMRQGPDTAGSYVIGRDWSSSNSWSWSTASSMAGVNTIMVNVRNSDGAGTVSRSVSYTIAQAITAIVISSLSPSMPGPVTAGTPVTWTAQASGGAGSYQYQFSRTGPDTGGTALVAQAWGTSNKWSWTPTGAMAGSNTVSVSVRNSDGTGSVSASAPAYTVNPAVPSGLVGYWKFAETSGATTADSSGLGNNGALNGAARVGGIADNAVSFSGSGANVLVPGTAALKPASTVSVMAWVKTAASTATGADAVSMGDNYGLRVLSDGNACFLFNNGGAGSAAWTVLNTAGVNVLDNQWHHLAAVKTSGGISIYVDGVLKASSAVSAPISYTLGSNLYIGTQGNGSVYHYFSGAVDEVRIYNTAMSAPEVQAVYAALTPPTPPPPPAPTGNAYYISPTGSDSGSGTLSSPWKTVGYASARLKAGDTLYARGGTYTGQSGWNSPSGTSSAPITFKAYPGETPVFDGGLTIGDFIVITKAWIVVDGITVQKFNNAYGNGGIDVYAGAANCIIQNCTIQNNGTAQTDHGIYVSSGTSNITIRNNIIRNNIGGGIHCWHGPNVNGLLVYNNVITGNKWGLIAADGAQNIEIYNNTFDKNGTAIHLYYDGQEVKTGVKNVVIKNNIISNSSSYGLQVASFNTAQVTGNNNLWYGNATTVQWGGSNWTLSQYQTSTANDRNSVSASPSFAGTGNYHLNSGSPAVDKGAALTKVASDKDNVARPQGAAYDIGAYEYR